tara:strand:- start:2117 stop:2503 length:387 start_codon:yes stop_codon:yes gene_type:complete
MRKRKQNQDLFPHPWGSWREEGLIPIEGSKAYWKSNNFGGYDLVTNAKTVAYVKRVTFSVSEDGIRSKDEVDHYVAVVESVKCIGHLNHIDTIEDLGQCKTSRDARQRILDHLAENRQGWDQSVEVPF